MGTPLTRDWARAPERRWLRWTRVIFLAVAPGSVQALLVWRLAPQDLPQSILLSTGFYLLFAFVPG